MSKRFDVQLSREAKKSLRRLDRPAQQRVLAALVLLGKDPRPPGAVAIKGRPAYLRIRVGDWRVVYTVQDDQLVVLALAIGHRRDVYRALP